MKIFDFQDYRSFLAAFYQKEKDRNPRFSYRAFARRAGYSSSGLYLDLVKGRKNLTERLVPGFCEALKLSDRECCYFGLMVEFTHAGSVESKSEIFEKMRQYLPSGLKTLRRDQWEYYSNWYYVVTREALYVLDIDENYKDLASFLKPSITVAQAKKAVKLLDSIGLIHKINGFWKPVDATLSSGLSGDVHLARSFQKKMIGLAIEGIDKIPPAERNVSCSTLSVSRAARNEIQGEIDKFRKKILDIVNRDADEKLVYQFNVQFFPVGGSEGEKA